MDLNATAEPTKEATADATLEPQTDPANEAFLELRSLARRRSGAIPPELLASHALAVTQGADWPVHEAALQALLRRVGFAKRDQLRVAKRPGGAKPLGRYAIRRKGQKQSERPYLTVLESLAPPRGTCDCPDYLKNSLGLCKHVLVILDDLYSQSEVRVAKTLAVAKAHADGAEVIPGPRFDPIRPLRGSSDLLQQVVWPTLSLGESSRRPLAARRRAARRFVMGKDGVAALRAIPTDPKIRLSFVSDLLSVLRSAKAKTNGDVAADPALKAHLIREEARLTDLLANRKLVQSSTTALRGLKRKLYPYQLEGVQRFLSSGRLLLADDMGLGKTVQAAAACHVLFHAGRVRRGVLIVPASLKGQWLREWEATTDVPAEMVEGRPAERAEQYRRLRSGFLIMNYEQLLRDLDLVRQLGPDMVVLDEAQRIKNWATKTSMYVKVLTPRYRLVLTGTPMENRIDELASVLDWVDDFALAPKWRLAAWHTQVEGDGGTRRFAARNLETLRARMEGSVLRRVRKDVLKQLPPRTDVRVPVQMTEQQAEAHAELDQPIASLTSRARKRPLTQPEFLRLMQLLTAQRMISNGLGQVNFESVWPTYSRVERPDAALIDGLFSPKLHELRRLITDVAIQQERTIVVFSQWRRMLRLAQWAVRDLLEDAGLRAVFFTGAEKQRQRTQNVIELHDDPAVRVMFLSDAGGVGLNLQRAASCCINLELPWNPAVLEQRIGRIYRLGQKRPIDVYNLVTETGIESRISRSVAGKRALFSGLFDGTSDEIRFESDGSFLSQLERLIEPAEAPRATMKQAAPQEGADTDEDDPDFAQGVDANSDDGVRAGDDVAANRSSTEDERKANGAPAGPPAPAVNQASAVSAAAMRPNDEAIRDLFSAITVRQTDRGGIAIEAPPEAAAALVSVFEGMANLLRAQGRRP